MTWKQPFHQLVATLLLFAPCGAVITPTELPASIQNCYNNNSDTSLRDVVGESFCYYCEDKNIQVMTPLKDLIPKDPESLRYIARLVHGVNAIKSGGRVKRQVRFPPCRRKEYRMLTEAERTRFHDGLNALKRNSTNYDALAGLHSGFVIDSAHGGPNFLGWHRVYLLLMENALRDIDISICLPYWDSSLDNELPFPEESNIFSSDFLGGRQNGPVNDGPFAGWRMPWGIPLIRNVGAGGQLYSVAAISNILSQTRTAQITDPNAMMANNLEFNHNGVHNFVGGQMSQLQTAAFDPAFFLHHAFVDYLWETFRNRQRAFGIDPERDYPVNFGSPLHAPDIGLGFGFGLTAQDGYLNSIGAAVQYDPSPTCNRNRYCRSRYLQCNVERRRCIPVEPASRTPRAARYPPDSLLPVPPEPCMNNIVAIQNDYCIDGVCDIRKWVYVAVNVVSNRPPDFKSYRSYPVLNGDVEDTYDVYQPAAYIDTSRYSYPAGRAPKHYERCSSSGVGQVYVQATGLNYNGYYKESSLVDQRLATAISIAYVAIKNPQSGPVKALFRAFDKCGRLCKPACRIPGTKKFRTCSGAMEISNVPGKPNEYSYSYGQASADTLDMDRDADCPRFDNEEIALTFYCDYTSEVPWTSPSAVQQRLTPRAHSPPQSVTTECRVDQDCTLSVPCGEELCMEGDSFRCRGSCHKYAECKHGVYWKKTCPPGSAFDHKTMSCIKGGICFVRTTNMNRRTGPQRLVRPGGGQSHLASRLGVHPRVLSPSHVNSNRVLRPVQV